MDVVREQKLRKLYQLSTAEPNGTESLNEFENFIQFEFNGFVMPHVNDAIDKAKDEDDFIEKLKQFEWELHLAERN